MVGVVKREKGCTCSDAVVAANAKPVDGRYVGHESSCPLHWPAKRAK